METTITNPIILLEQLYAEAIGLVRGGSEPDTLRLNHDEQQWLDTIIRYSESSKGVLTVAITSLTYKLLHPEQDVRLHQANMAGGYSGRSFDSRHITPFLKQMKFPAMAESGWLTRSLEQNRQYDLDYSGSITPIELKTAFLQVLDKAQIGVDCRAYLLYLFQKLILQRDTGQIDLARPTNLPIATIVDYLVRQFNAPYNSHGASRLPVIALYAIYECLINELQRFQGKTLTPLESHTSADRRSGNIGDIQVVDETGVPFEAVEVKHGIKITAQLVRDAFEKFKIVPVKRYYILSTADIAEGEAELVREEIRRIHNTHGCQVIANGMVSSLTYYLRLLNDPSEFIQHYVALLEADKALKYEHKAEWNKIVSG